MLTPFMFATAYDVNPGRVQVTGGETKLNHIGMKQSAQTTKLVGENSKKKKSLGSRFPEPFGHNIPLTISSMKLNIAKFCHNHSFITYITFRNYISILRL